jgi:hypothetical protein
MSYVVEHEHLTGIERIVAAGNRILAGKPSGYRLASRLSAHRVILRRLGRLYLICGENTATGSGVICAATVLPVNAAPVVWAGGANLRQAVRLARISVRQTPSPAGLPSLPTIVAMGIDWMSAIGFSGAPVVLAGALLALVTAAALASWRRERRRGFLFPAMPAVPGLVAIDLALRLHLRPHGGVQHLVSGAGAFNVALGGSVLHRSVAVWGDEGRTASVLLALATAVAVVLAARLGHRLLFFATCLAAAGTLTNTLEKATRGYATDYLWLGSIVHTTPFNLGDVYEFAGFVMVALCAARLIALQRAPAARPAGHPAESSAGRPAAAHSTGISELIFARSMPSLRRTMREIT